MTREVFYRLVDDLTGEPVPEGTGVTLEFGYEGATYEIDLSDANADAYHQFLSKYVEAARKVGARSNRTASASSSPKSNKDELAKIRSWAKSEGLKVSDRGRISAEIQQAYQAAH